MRNNSEIKVISIDGLLTAQEAAKLLTVSPRTLWGLTKSGALPAIKIGRSVRYARADIDAFIASRRTTKAEG
jgi:excisionase family DNA binding protein